MRRMCFFLHESYVFDICKTVYTTYIPPRFALFYKQVVLAQMVECALSMREARGSIPLDYIFFLCIICVFFVYIVVLCVLCVCVVFLKLFWIFLDIFGYFCVMV